MNVDTNNTQVSLDDLFRERCPELVDIIDLICGEEVKTEELQEGA